MTEPTIRHIPRDLPEPTPNDPLPQTWERVRVFKEGDHWTWEHLCPWFPASDPAHGYPHLTHKIALFYAWDHARRCL